MVAGCVTQRHINVRHPSVHRVQGQRTTQSPRQQSLSDGAILVTRNATSDHRELGSLFSTWMVNRLGIPGAVGLGVRMV